MSVPEVFFIFWTRFVARFFDQVFGQVFGIRADGRGGEGGGGNTVLQFYWDGEIQFYRTFLILTVELTNPNSRD